MNWELIIPSHRRRIHKKQYRVELPKKWGLRQFSDLRGVLVRRGKKGRLKKVFFCLCLCVRVCLCVCGVDTPMHTSWYHKLGLWHCTYFRGPITPKLEQGKPSLRKKSFLIKLFIEWCIYIYTLHITKKSSTPYC